MLDVNSMAEESLHECKAGKATFVVYLVAGRIDGIVVIVGVVLVVLCCILFACVNAY